MPKIPKIVIKIDEEHEGRSVSPKMNDKLTHIWENDPFYKNGKKEMHAIGIGNNTYSWHFQYNQWLKECLTEEAKLKRKQEKIKAKEDYRYVMVYFSNSMPDLDEHFFLIKYQEKYSWAKILRPKLTQLAKKYVKRERNENGHLRDGMWWLDSPDETEYIYNLGTHYCFEFDGNEFIEQPRKPKLAVDNSK